MSMEFLDEYNGYLPSLPRSYGRVCCICGRDKTYICDDTPVWTKYKDKNGKWNGEWVCNNCRRYRKGHKFIEYKCRLCGSNDTYVRSNGEHLWIRDFDVNQKFIGYICYKCAYQDNRPPCGHKNRIYKIYDNKGMWTGKRRCSICSK